MAGAPCARGLPGVEGALCPEIEHEPRTIEGREVLDVLDRHGVWKRAGMTGLVAGLDLREAMASLPDYCDRARCKRLLLAGERAFVSALIEREAKEKPDGK